MRIKIDRDLPVPVAVQIRGLIEFGVSNGDFKPGSRLPSVRSLAAELGTSPVTVSQAYRTLQDRGLIETTPGRGTFVREVLLRTGSVNNHSRVTELLGSAIRAGLREGLDRSELLDRFQRLLGQEQGSHTPLSGTFVGIYPEVTEAYVADLRRHLQPADRLTATTFAALAQGADSPVLAGTDFIFTFAHRMNDLEELLSREHDIAAVQFIPSERTRLALAEIDPLDRVVLVSTVEEFLPTFKHGVRRFASHVANIRGVLLDSPGAHEAIADADVVVYATGSEGVLNGMPGRIRSFEYRHVPDPFHTEQALLPFLERVRAGKVLTEQPEEVT
jgi:DNA-binding transcriptional regulator YhcF (GntR family)